MCNNQYSKSSTQKTVLITNNIIDDIDELEDIIGDEAFAAFLNYDAEIQIREWYFKKT